MNELINRYILDEMDSKEMAAFEERLTHDQELRQALEDAEGTLEAIRVYQIDQTRKELLEYAHQKKKTVSVKPSRFLYYGLAAAVIIFIFILGPLNLLKKENPIEQSLAEFVNSDNVRSSFRGSDLSDTSNTNVLIDNILAFTEVYHAGDDQALTAKLQELEKYIEEDSSTFFAPRRKALAIYMGAGYYKLKQYVKARAYFEHAKDSRHSDVAEEILKAPFWKEQGL